jgi:hypothetical protein
MYNSHDYNRVVEKSIKQKSSPHGKILPFSSYKDKLPVNKQHLKDWGLSYCLDSQYRLFAKKNESVFYKDLISSMKFYVKESSYDLDKFKLVNAYYAKTFPKTHQRIKREEEHDGTADRCFDIYTSQEYHDFIKNLK